MGRGIQQKSHLSTTPSFNSFFQGKILRGSHSRLKSPRNMSSTSQKSKYDLRCNLYRNEHHVLCHSEILKQITHVTFAEEEMVWKVTGSHGQSKHPAIRGKLFNGGNVASDTRMLCTCPYWLLIKLSSICCKEPSDLSLHWKVFLANGTGIDYEVETLAQRVSCVYDTLWLAEIL